ncbi:MAG: hypothetical protein Hals2KO_23150 [Halioglobus sp.]
MPASSASLPHNQFLLVAGNLLHRALLEPTRAEAKQRFRGLQDGRSLALQTVQMEDGSHARFGVALDYSEFRGRLNFGAFRASVQTLVGNISDALKEEREVKTFTADGNDAAMIFGITGVTLEAQQANVMVLGIEPDSAGQATLLKLMYLDPQQFLPQESASA